MAKFEQRFEGRDNAGLRARVRDAVSGRRCGGANAAAVRSLGQRVALSACGRAMIEAVASDYGAVSDYRRTCDCEACYAGNLQYLGALG